MNTNRIVTLAVALLVSISLSEGLAKEKAEGGGEASDAHSRRGIELAQEKKFDEAIAEFTKALQADPGNPVKYRNRGSAYRQAGRFPEAAADFSKMIQLAPKDSMGYFERGQTAVAQNQLDPALEDLNKAL